MLKAVPKHVEIAYGLGNLTEDPRYWFFLIPTSKKKFYYRRNGENLEKLGRYTELTITSHPRSNITSANGGLITYIIYFDKTPEKWFHAQMDDELYYSDEPLSDSDLDYNNNPDIKSIINSYGGRKTKRYRKYKKSKKSKKSRKSKKYYK
jgi:hypothetical protein